MNHFLGTKTARFAGATAVTRGAASTLVLNDGASAKADLFIKGVIVTGPAVPVSLPLASSQNGNLFVDRNDPNLHWYLPDFALADDVDPGFAFVASQSPIEGQGGVPFYIAQVTLRILKSQPDDVVNFSQANPSAKVQEIPLAEMSAILASSYMDQGGQQQQRTVSGTIQDLGNGEFSLIFSPIKGDSVIEFYNNLTAFGNAVINLSASYQAWSQQRLRFFYSAQGKANIVFKEIHADTTNTRGIRTRESAKERIGLAARLGAEQPPSPPLVQTRQSWAKPLPLGLKYKQDGYQLKYTVSTATITSHVIRDANDLKDFSLSQSEFTELKALGDVSQRYPTLSRLYIGVLSRTIVVIPKRYSIVRGRLGCAAMCMALVDSSAADGSKCKFEFDFTIAPEVSRIEFLKLTQEILGREDLKDYTPKLPDFQNDNPPSTLQTEFKSNVQFSAGSDPHTFAITVSVHDDGSQTPAAANANLFIKRLSPTVGADLVGSLSIKLDDGYPDSVLSTIDLNFAHSASTDEIVVNLDEASAQIKLTNQSPLDLQLSRYALINGPLITAEVPGPFVLPANGSLSVPLPQDHIDLMLAVDAQLVIPNPMTKSDVARFLDFQTADVQETQYVVAVNGAGIDFNKVDSIVVSITFSNLPDVMLWTLKLSKNLRADSTHIVIPLENAVFSLPGTANLTVHFVDSGINDLNFTLEHDFTSDPVLIVRQSDIDKNLPET